MEPAEGPVVGDQLEFAEIMDKVADKQNVIAVIKRISNVELESETPCVYRNERIVEDAVGYVAEKRRRLLKRIIMPEPSKTIDQKNSFPTLTLCPYRKSEGQASFAVVDDKAVPLYDHGDPNYRIDPIPQREVLPEDGDRYNLNNEPAPETMLIQSLFSDNGGSEEASIDIDLFGVFAMNRICWQLQGVKTVKIFSRGIELLSLTKVILAAIPKEKFKQARLAQIPYSGRVHEFFFLDVSEGVDIFDMPTGKYKVATFLALSLHNHIKGLPSKLQDWFPILDTCRSARCDKYIFPNHLPNMSQATWSDFLLLCNESMIYRGKRLIKRYLTMTEESTHNDPMMCKRRPFWCKDEHNSMNHDFHRQGNINLASTKIPISVSLKLDRGNGDFVGHMLFSDKNVKCKRFSEVFYKTDTFAVATQYLRVADKGGIAFADMWLSSITPKIREKNTHFPGVSHNNLSCETNGRSENKIKSESAILTKKAYESLLMSVSQADDIYRPQYKSFSTQSFMGCVELAPCAIFPVLPGITAMSNTPAYRHFRESLRNELSGGTPTYPLANGHHFFI